MASKLRISYSFLRYLFSLVARTPDNAGFLALDALRKTKTRPLACFCFGGA